SNLAELVGLVTKLLATGRAATAADVLEKANPPERSSWDVLDRLATLRLHLGEPARARSLWQLGAKTATDRAIATARIAATYLAEENFDAASKHYRLALEANPNLFEAAYGLAVLEQDAGNAEAAFELATKAAALAPNDRSRESAALILRSVKPFAKNGNR
ncbi:MAG: tetratricopeptide repeat protein, partial [Isosphaeraceae bacterium]